ncbi:MAG TPA: TIGR03790 family protein [Candidatus Polarisedimenticolia bacterium]|nr:TIGR03790 family protein [Candidatus Polarisedimenticolia bacterium]
MRNSLTILLFLAAALTLQAANPGDEVIVIYNKRMPESKDVAQYYAAKRHVPASQIFGFNLTTNEDISREDFRDDLQKPLAKDLESKKLWHIGSEIYPGTNGQPGKVVWRVKQSKIRYAVLCYGVPLRIAEDPNLKEKVPEMRPELRRNDAAVDSELATLPWIEEHLPVTGLEINSSYTTTNKAWLNPTNGILMVTRLDGPNASIARGLVDKAMEAETNGLCGRAYFDWRGVPTNSPLIVGDEWIMASSKISQYYGGYETLNDTNPATFPADFPMNQTAIYCGWYDENASGPFAQDDVEFMPGAFAYHLHSFSAATLRSTTRNWVGPLLAKGAAATMGCVDEPFIGGTPDVSVFLGRWIVYGFTFGEAAYAAQHTLSWQTTVVGDPLYRPFGKSLQALIEQQERTHNSSVEWSYLREVNIALLSGKPAAEIAASLEALPATKKSAVLTEKLGDLYDALGKPASATEAYVNALKLNPSPLQRVRIRLALADKLTELNQAKEAAADLRALLNEDPDYPGRAAIEKKAQDLASKANRTESASAPPGGTNP